MRSEDRRALTAFLQRVRKGDRPLSMWLHEHAASSHIDVHPRERLEATRFNDELAHIVDRLPNQTLECLVSLYRPVLDIRRMNGRSVVDLAVPELEFAELQAIRTALRDVCPAVVPLLGSVLKPLVREGDR